MTSVLVLGGVRSGKSRYAEGLLAAQLAVTYVAPGPVPDLARDADGGTDGGTEWDAEWAARIRAHRQRRPAHWRTVETADVPGAIRTAAAAGQAVLVDCLGTWLTRLVDDAGPQGAAWGDREAAAAVVDAGTTALIAALREACAAGVPVVLVSNEVGLGVVPEHASGRLFRDLLGRLNAAVADAADHVALVVAGRVLDLSSAPTLADAPPLPPTRPLPPDRP